MKVAVARHTQRTVPQAAFARCRCSKTKRCGIAKAACRHTGDRNPAPRGSNRGWCLADAIPRSCILDRRRSCLRGLTFELSRHQRCDARARVAKMYRVPPAGPAWHAVGARLERGVRQHAAMVAVHAKCSRSNFGALTRRPRWWPAVTASRGDGGPALTRAGTDPRTRF